MPNSLTPDWKLACFKWLDLDRWTVDTILSDGLTNGKHYCKVCDGFVDPKEAEQHVANHVEEEKSRDARVKAEAAKTKHEQKEWERKENAALAGKEYVPRNTTFDGKMSGKVSDYVIAMREALVDADDGLTLVALSEATSLDLTVVRNHHRKVEGIEVIRTIPTGGRGKPSNVYGLAKSTTKED